MFKPADSSPFRWVALSGDPADIHRTDRAVLETFPEDEALARWITKAQESQRMLLLCRTTPRDQVQKPTDGMTVLFAPIDPWTQDIG